MCAYTTKEKIRLLSNVVIADVSDDDVDSLITESTAQVNSDINTRVVREKVVPIDNTRENKINGSNTVYYVQNWKGKWLGDTTDSGTITTTDVIVYQVASDGTETTLTVSAIDSENGKITLSSAPASSVELFITYEWAFIDPDTPSPKLSLACAFLTISFCYRKINTGMSPQQVYGNVRFMRDMRAHDKWFQSYENEMAKINAEMGSWAEAEVF